MRGLYITSCAPDSAPVGGCGCDEGAGLTLGELDEVEGAELEAGDPSPAGRCPHCCSLSYLDRPADRAMDRAEALKETLADTLEFVRLCPVHTEQGARRDAVLERADKLLAFIDRQERT